MTFNINYLLKDGSVGSFQNGGPDENNLCPIGCATLSFSEVFPQLWDSQGNIIMKVNLKTKQLELINPVIIPQGTPVV